MEERGSRGGGKVLRPGEKRSPAGRASSEVRERRWRRAGRGESREVAENCQPRRAPGFLGSGRADYPALKRADNPVLVILLESLPNLNGVFWNSWGGADNLAI